MLGAPADTSSTPLGSGAARSSTCQTAVGEFGGMWRVGHNPAFLATVTQDPAWTFQGHAIRWGR